MSYIPHTDADRAAMLERIGVGSVDDLFASLPGGVRLDRPLDLPPALDEMALTAHMQALARRNADLDANLCFLGAGIYDHYVPTVVDALASRGEFLTAYTPYQPELSQGMLQAVYEYQSLICVLTEMEMANASMYDGATALAEAALMAIETTGRHKAVVSRATHPHYRKVVQTYLEAAGFQYAEVGLRDCGTDPADAAAALDDTAACLVYQHPNFLGCLEEQEALNEAARRAGALVVTAVDPIALGLLTPPGRFGADVVVGEGQPLGCAPAFGGPLLGFFACKSEYQRKFPGRIVGATTDGQGRRGYTMTLRTREQDIRRDRATSNICTNEALLALCATIYLTQMGADGLREVADLCLQKAHYAQARIAGLAGFAPAAGRPFFKEFAVRLPAGLTPRDANERLLERGIVGGYDLGRDYPDLAGAMLLCVTETKTRADIDRLVDVLAQLSA